MWLLVIGGIGSIKGAFVGSILVGVTDTLGRVFLPDLLKVFMQPAEATAIGSSIGTMLIYILMALILIANFLGCLEKVKMIIEKIFNKWILFFLLIIPFCGLIFGEPYYITLTTKVIILAIAGIGLNLALGYCGLISFGHAAFLERADT